MEVENFEAMFQTAYNPTHALIFASSLVVILVCHSFPRSAIKLVSNESNPAAHLILDLHCSLQRPLPPIVLISWAQTSFRVKVSLYTCSVNGASSSMDESIA